MASLPRLAVLVVFLLAAAPAPAPAQVVPTPAEDPGLRLLREQRERERRERLEQGPAQVEVPGERPAPIDPDATPDSIAEVEPSFEIREIELKGNTLLSREEVERIVAPFLDRRLGVNRINLLLRRVTEAYVSRGYITTRAYVDSQNLASGGLVVTVFEGRIETIRIDDQKASGRGLWPLPFREGDVLRLQDIEQGVDQINRLRANQAEVRVLPGQTPGSSIVQIRNAPGDRFRYTVGADNYGQIQTGSGRVRLGAEADNVLGIQDALSLIFVGSLDTNAVLFNASVPWGYNTFSYSYAYSEFQNLVGDVALVYGTFNNQSAGWNRVFGRGTDGRWAIDATLSLRETQRSVNGVDLTPARITVARVAASRLQRLPRGFALAELGVVQGLDAVGASQDAPDLPDGAPHAQFAKVDLNGTVAWQLTDDWSYRAQLGGQYAWRGLFSSEQIFIGGAGTVRGFVEAALAGDRGFFLRNELGWLRVPSWPVFGAELRTDPFLFFDYGQVRTLALPSGNALSSVGVGVRLVERSISAEASFGLPISFPDFLPRTGGRVSATINYVF